ncbi:MAG: hypothetical protein A4E49_03153 [Methanosaeta sp. PtaU1.Bin112]|nr:MAG: hypothetical protein A4E49_03153 [Methanosaeta sp. PtaU1.Bin112]
MSACTARSLENILFSGAYSIEGKRLLCEEDRAFWHIWSGGVIRGRRLTLRCQLAEDEQGRLLYNGRLYNRDSWTWRPPKFIRLRGRYAKENPDPLNSYPTEIREKEDGSKERMRRVCDRCGGRLVYDIITLDLYCQECFIVSEAT